MKKIMKYILCVATVIYYLFIFIMPIISSPGLNPLGLILVNIILIPLSSVPVAIMWSIYDDWDKPGSPFFRWLNGLP